MDIAVPIGALHIDAEYLMSAGMCLFAHIQCTYLTVSINTLIKLLIIIPVPVISAGFDVLVLPEFI